MPKEYNFDYSTSGKCLILNYEIFQHKKPRGGSDKDAEYLSKVFSKMNFKVIIHNDLTLKKTKEVINAVGKDDYSEDACFVCCILTHGDEERLYTYDGCFKIQQLLSSLFSNNCPSLAGKPKIFFIQACQGDKYDDGVDLETADSSCTCDYPKHEDFLIVHSTMQGFFSWRSPDKGSWFIQTLCCFLEYSLQEDLHLLQILTQVNHSVAYYRESNTPSNLSTHKKKQVPRIISTLRKKVVLFRKGTPFHENTIENETEDVVDRGLKTKNDNEHGHRTLGKLTVPIDSEEYRMADPHNVRCLIIYNEDFEPFLKFQPLQGVTANALRLYRSFTEFNFSVDLVSNKNVSEIKSTLKKEIEDASSKLDCFFCIIMTRGDTNGILYSNDGRYTMESVVSMFSGENCSVLASKPKIFMFQVCESEKYMDESTDSGSVCTIPSKADIFTISSILKEGNYLQNTSNLISYLYEAFKENLNQVDFFDMMTSINDLICDRDNNENTLTLTSTLTRSLIFKI